jgi:hypothetical protein
MLGSPVVIGPVSPCNTAVRVQGQLPGATIDLFAVPFSPGQPVTRHVGSSKVDSANAMVELFPGMQLRAGEHVTAQQRLGTDVGPPIPAELAVEVMAYPRPEDLAGLFCPETLLDCGGCLWVEGVYPGATVTLAINTAPPLQAATQERRVKFHLPAGQHLATGDVLTATQFACGLQGDPVGLASPVAQFRGEWPVAPPSVQLPLRQCQAVVRLEDLVRPGAMVVIEHNGDPHLACIGYAKNEGIRLRHPLAAGDTVEVWQEFPRCELKSHSATHPVVEGNPPAPAVLGPICEGDRLLRVAGLLEDALVEVAADGDHLCMVAAPGATATFGIPSLLGRANVIVRQSICAGAVGTWSDWSQPCPVRPLGPQSQPQIVVPLIERGVAVGVTGLRRGSLVQIVSPAGVIGEAVANGDARIDVGLWYALVRDDHIGLRTVRCGKLTDWPSGAPVEAGPDDNLQPPHVKNPACDCGGSVLVEAVTHGAVVEVYREYTSTSHVLIGTWAAGASAVSVDVPKLAGDERVCARQRLGVTRSGMGPVATAAASPHWGYEPFSAFRLCQLTQDSDPGDRPHPVPTSQYRIVGTDLGIPVEHESRLYLFFGDSAQVGDEVDGDPMAWLTTSDPDDLEERAPDMHWILNGAGVFHWLSVNGEGLGNFEVPTGGFSYDGRLYLFVGRNKQENPSRMTTSTLVVRNDPFWDFIPVLQISSTTGGQILVLEPDGTIHPAPYPGRRWMLHISPTVVQNADWPGLPSSTGDGLLMFGTSAYKGIAPDVTPAELATGNVYLAWAPLTPGVIPPHAPLPGADQWQFFAGCQPDGTPTWRMLSVGPPAPLLPVDASGPRNLGELSVVWYPQLRRWILAGTLQAPINVARQPWGPWTGSDWILDAGRADRDAGNGQWVWTDSNVTYAPYLIHRWLRWDRSLRHARLYFTLSGFDDREGKPKYQPQLVRSTIKCWP